VSGGRHEQIHMIEQVAHARPRFFSFYMQRGAFYKLHKKKVDSRVPFKVVLGKEKSYPRQRSQHFGREVWQGGGKKKPAWFAEEKTGGSLWKFWASYGASQQRTERKGEEPIMKRAEREKRLRTGVGIRRRQRIASEAAKFDGNNSMGSVYRAQKREKRDKFFLRRGSAEGAYVE